MNGEFIIAINGEQKTEERDGVTVITLKPELREQIVRCRDCKHHELLTVWYSDKPLSVCTAEWCEGEEGYNLLVEPDGFCKWGERKEVDE